MIVDRTSQQYKLLYSGNITHSNDGLLYYEDYVCVALGSRFGNIGDKFLITLDNGKQFKVIKLDEKSNEHTVNNCHHLSDGSLIEFVIDINKAAQYYDMVITMGDFNHEDKFNGNIVKIQREVE